MKKSEQVSVPSKDGIRASSKTGDMITNKNKNNLKKKEESNHVNLFLRVLRIYTIL